MWPVRLLSWEGCSGSELGLGLRLELAASRAGYRSIRCLTRMWEGVRPVRESVAPGSSEAKSSADP